MIALAAHRRPTSPPDFQPYTSELMTSLASHVAAVALDYLEAAVFVLDANSRIQFASAAAKRLLETGRLSASNGLLSSPDESEITALRRLVKQCAKAAASGPAQMTFDRLGAGDDVLSLAMVGVQPSVYAEPDKGLVMLFVANLGDASQPDIRQLRSHFGLTEAQAKLAIEIAKGEGLKACTRRLGIAMSTGRSHLKQIFEKTETKRQAELVRLLSACRFNVPGSEAVA